MTLEMPAAIRDYSNSEALYCMPVCRHEVDRVTVLKTV